MWLFDLFYFGIITIKYLKEIIRFTSLLGGATVFPWAGISVSGEKGDGILWFNLLRNGKLDAFSTHMSCSLVLGRKFIGTKWERYNGQWNDMNCNLNENSTFSVPYW